MGEREPFWNMSHIRKHDGNLGGQCMGGEGGKKGRVAKRIQMAAFRLDRTGSDWRLSVDYVQKALITDLVSRSFQPFV